MRMLTADRRKSTRKLIKSGIVALLPPDGPIKIGNIIDINNNGVSFIMDTTEQTWDLKNQFKMDILLINENVFLEHVTTSFVSEKIWQDGRPAHMALSVNRYGVTFDNIEPSQERQLRRLTTETNA